MVQTRIAVLGAGSWGTALAANLANGGRAVTLWARCPDSARVMQVDRRNPTYLKHLVLPHALRITSNLAEATQDASMWVMATPSHGIRALALTAMEYAHADLQVVCVAKGIERETGLTMTHVLSDVLNPPVSRERIAVLYGPSHAEELAAGKPTTVVAAAPCIQTATSVQRTFMTGMLRVYVNEDVFGVEIAGSVKNIIADRSRHKRRNRLRRQCKSCTDHSRASRDPASWGGAGRKSRDLCRIDGTGRSCCNLYQSTQPQSAIGRRDRTRSITGGCDQIYEHDRGRGQDHGGRA